jgi:OOP family OmpA-OmpF porin
MIRRYPALVLSFLIGSASVATAQTIGYGDAISRFAAGCGQDIAKYCKTVNLGGGRIQQCLDQNQARVSGQCRTTIVELRSLLQKRAAARANVIQVCDIDIRRLCAGVQPGDGNLLECFMKAERSASAQCRQAVTDAGYR